MGLTGTGTSLANKIVNDITAQFPSITPIQKAQMLASWTTICNDIVDHIVTNAVIDPDSMAITPTLILDSTHAPCSGDGSVNVGTGKIT